MEGAARLEQSVKSGAKLRPLEAVGAGDLERVGGKAAGLGALLAHGFEVPRGMVLTCDALQECLDAAGLSAGASQSQVLALALAGSVEAALLECARTLGPGPLAVRSSAPGEDGALTSYAGQYVTVLGVEGPEALTLAVRRCWASAFSPRLLDYRRSHGQAGVPRMAIVVQQQLAPSAAGVAFTANPVSGDRAEAVVSAVKGLGERLVSGEATGDEWVVRGNRAEARRSTEQAIDAAQALAVAALARKVEVALEGPQDIEWALAQGKLWLLQARPITALPAQVEWKSPLAGGWTRNFRFGEWLPDPVTPLFESWLLGRLEGGLNDFYRDHAGISQVPPDHVLIHGWYFGSLNFIPGLGSMLWQLLTRMLPRLLFKGRRALAMLPPLHRFCIELFAQDRVELLAQHRAIVADATGQLETAPHAALPALIDRLADRAGRLFGMISILGGYAWKTELPLAELYRDRLGPVIGGSHLDLLQGLFVPGRAAHDVQSLDWVRPTLGETGAVTADDAAQERQRRLEEKRRKSEASARQALAGDSKTLARFDALLAVAQRFAPIRDELASQLTIGWPAMRRAVERIGEALVASGQLASSAQAHFLTRGELLDALVGKSSARLTEQAQARSQAWEGQRRLLPPLSVGEPPKLIKGMLEQAERPFRHAASGATLVSGLGASPGRAIGPVRIIHRVEDFSRFQDGDVLVAAATMPAWTPLFPRAAAVVTDIGSVIAHAALVAREYGIPAVVATGNATAVLRNGDLVEVDGGRGLVDRVTPGVR